MNLDSAVELTTKQPSNKEKGVFAFSSLHLPGEADFTEAPTTNLLDQLGFFVTSLFNCGF
jgi:hypothetical protein